MNVLRLHPDGGGSAITIEHAIVRVGRDSSCDVHLRDASVSRLHAEIELRGEEWLIIDQNSGNGIRIDGRRVQKAVLLPGQLLHIGNLKFRVEIDRGNDGATMMLGRSPLLEDPGDRTMMGAPPVFPKERKPKSTLWMITVTITVAALLGVGLASVKYFSDRRTKEAARAAAAAAKSRPTPTPTPTPTPEPTPTPTPVPPPRPTGSLLISTDVDSSVSIDGRVVAQLKASGLRRFDVRPGEHIVNFLSDGVKTEMVVRVRVNEQTVVRRVSETVVPTATPSPSALATPK